MDRRSETTRRQYLKYGAGAVGAALVAGCLDSGPGGTSNGTAGNGSNSGDSYSVSMEPVGEVTFEGVPETWVANNGSWADMGVALGREPPKGVWMTSRYHTQYYDAVDGVSVDKSDMVSLYQDGVSKERFYELDADVHVMDPNFLQNRYKGWEEGDVEELRTNVAPFFGNSIFSRGYPWHEDYRYYSLYEAFEKLAQVFVEVDRYEAFASLHDTVQGNLGDVVPPEGERPSVAVFWGTGDQPETFLPYLISEGTSFKHLRDLGVTDALASTDVKDFHGSRSEIDFETLLEVDPEVVLLRGYEAKSAQEFEDTVVAFLENHPTGGELTAVENGDVYRAGGLYQGPITNLVLTERTARDLYGFEGELFDRGRVADIVDGNL